MSAVAPAKYALWRWFKRTWFVKRNFCGMKCLNSCLYSVCFGMAEILALTLTAVKIHEQVNCWSNFHTLYTLILHSTCLNELNSQHTYTVHHACSGLWLCVNGVATHWLGMPLDIPGDWDSFHREPFSLTFPPWLSFHSAGSKIIGEALCHSASLRGLIG